MSVLLACLVLGLLFGYLAAVVFPCPLRLSAVLGALAGLGAALLIPALAGSY